MTDQAAPKRSPELPPRPQHDPRIEVTDIQGNLLRGYGHPSSAYLFAHLDDADGGRPAWPERSGQRWLGGLLDDITTAEPWDVTPERTLNVSFTWTGLAALGVDGAILDSFPEEFREGMANRHELLGDRGPSAPDQWEPGFGTGAVHVLVEIHGTDPDARGRCLARVHDSIAATGGAVTVVAEHHADLLPTGRDHFGFADGISRPAIEGSGVEARPGDGFPVPGGGWRSIPAGEFVLGYRDEDSGIPEAPAPPFDCNATFEVYRKMSMDVALHRRFVREAASLFPGGTPDLVAAKIVGRWPDGTPLSTSPDGPDPAIANDPDRVNDFRFEDDPRGLKCPLGSHVRRTNPRDADGFFDGRLSNRHKIVRRGRPYGPPLPDSATDDDGTERGLIFRAFNASIFRQFEIVQALWVDDGDGFGLGNEKDFLVGDPTGANKMTVPGTPPVFLSPQPMFTTVRGGEYLFRPGMRALRWLAGGAG